MPFIVLPRLCVVPLTVCVAVLATPPTVCVVLSRTPPTVFVTPPSKPPPPDPLGEDVRVDVEPEPDRSLSNPLAEAAAVAFVIETIEAVIGVIVPPFFSSL